MDFLNHFAGVAATVMKKHSGKGRRSLADMSPRRTTKNQIREKGFVYEQRLRGRIRPKRECRTLHNAEEREPQHNSRLVVRRSTGERSRGLKEASVAASGVTGRVHHRWRKPAKHNLGKNSEATRD